MHNFALHKDMFIDVVEIKIAAGRGGDGKVSFHREKYVAAGGPDGGDGGKGGDIIFQVDDNLSTLADFKYKRKYHAENGGNGDGSRKNGKKGADLIIKVPRGTIIKEVESEVIIADMSKTETFVAAKGGRGGWGNVHFATPTRQVPRFAKPGTPGEEWTVRLELKLLADVGLLGFPNVGKSTFISVVSAAKPVIADYHFTTLSPVLGVVYMGEGSSFVIADIPGIIEGASDGIGLGHEFLRHIGRCRMLVHILDAGGSEARDPKEDFEIINSELEKFNPQLAEVPQIVVANKIDLATDEQIEDLRQYITSKGYEFYTMSAPIAYGTTEVRNAIAAKLATLPPIKYYEAEEIPLDVLEKKITGKFTVECDEDVYYVEADWLWNILRRVDMDDYESLQYFQRVLQSSGIIDALREKGINEGDTVDIYGFTFEFVN